MKKIFALILVFSTQLSLGYELTKVEAISATRRTFITQNGKSSGYFKGSVVTFTTDDISFTARAIVATREYAQWLVLRPELKLPLKKGTELVIDKGKESLELLQAKFDVDQEYIDQQKLYALNGSAHLRQKAHNLARINDLMAQINENERWYMDPERTGHPYQRLGVADRGKKHGPQAQEETQIKEIPEQKLALENDLEAVEKQLEEQGYARSDAKSEAELQALLWKPSGKHFFAIKYGTIQSESITVSGVTESSFTSAGNLIEFEYQYMINSSLSTSLGYRRESEAITSQSLDLVSNRNLLFTGLNYHQGISENIEFLAGLYIGAGTSVTETSVSEQSGAYYLLPGLKFGASYYITKLIAITFEGATESLRIVEDLPDEQDGGQSTNQVNLRASAGLKIAF